VGKPDDGSLPMRTWRRVDGDERGATLVEFSIIAPLLFILLFGVIEFGWLFAKNTEVRHGAREAARLAVVDFGTETEIVNAACGRMGLATTAAVTVDLSKTGSDPGDLAIVTVTAQTPGLTPLLSWISPNQLTSTVEMRLEQPAGWGDAVIACP
jgi:Flp pilus assembly protein TadG